MIERECYNMIGHGDPCGGVNDPLHCRECELKIKLTQVEAERDRLAGALLVKDKIVKAAEWAANSASCIRAQDGGQMCDEEVHGKSVCWRCNLVRALASPTPKEDSK